MSPAVAAATAVLGHFATPDDLPPVTPNNIVTNSTGAAS
ncbi:MAG: hypothetical protein JWN39_3063 [Ilumatobacteraceae bacterium]|nr:hypothetical protein [Ilumatobacteraceae bacterium]